MAQERYDYIIGRLSENGSVTVSEISDALDVSIETVRRDLIVLENGGKLSRVFGGAILPEKSNHFESLKTRMESNNELKAELAETAVSFIKNGDIVALESGSTATQVAKAIVSSGLNITVITYSNTVFNILKHKLPVILIGGEYIEEDDCFGGFFTEEFAKNFHVNKAFLFPAALSLENGIESYILPTIKLERIFADISDKVFVLVDSDKFSARGAFKSLDLKKDYYYITDSKVNPQIKKEFKDKGYSLFAGEENV